jgi:hypothetical protein
MDNLANHECIGGQEVHIGDCQVWAGIFYLDSPTNYREYLSQNCGVHSLRSKETLVMLDEVPSQWNIRSLFWLLPVPMLFLVAFILYFAFGV